MKLWVGMVSNKQSIFGVDAVSVVADTEATAHERFIAKTGVDSVLYWTQWPDRRDDPVVRTFGGDGFYHNTKTPYAWRATEIDGLAKTK